VASKFNRLAYIEQLIISHPNGLSRAEIARRLGVNRSTVGRYVDELSEALPLYENEERLLIINRDRYLNRVEITLHEAMALYLAVQLMRDRTDRRYPHAISAVRKLSEALERFSEPIAAAMMGEADLMETSTAQHESTFLPVLEEVTRAWASRCIVELEHYSVRREVSNTYAMGIDAVIPYAIGQTFHVIGRNEADGSSRTLRLDRVQAASVTRRAYEPRKPFDKRRHFSGAWGVWTSEEEPVEVELRFSPAVSHRVQETIWHRSQQTTCNDDGSVTWKASIAEPREMYPWIRGWGSDVEIIKPATLRQQFISELERMREMYGLR